ncbi:DUF6525 family protein [Falsirhodobacter halotolerans]|nr:DUF6525 family protein [Falsirhodobacter halotolerans]MCJ8140934.1 DUF6525 family protein [Falsirhodobacter halotolerans]
MRRNLVTSLRRRGTGSMEGYDRLPPDVRAWLAGAALPWSARSALRIWRRAMADRPCPHHARACLCAAEARMLARDAPTVWGVNHPSVAGRP